MTRLVERIRRSSPDSVIVVSHDRSGVDLDVDALRADPGVMVRVEPGGYGDITHLRRYLATAQWLADEGIEVGWLTNITGQDYPVRPLAEVEAFLAGADADGFLQYFPVFSEESHWSQAQSRNRYHYRYRRVRLGPRRRRWLRPVAAVNRVQPWVRVNAAYGGLGRRAPSPFGPDLTCYGGSYFCTLSAACVRYVADFARERPQWLARLAATLAPEEVFFQTVLVNSGRFRLVNDCKRYFDFRGSTENHPRALGVADLPRIRATDAFFARKFDPAGDTAVLDALDAALENQC